MRPADAPDQVDNRLVRAGGGQAPAGLLAAVADHEHIRVAEHRLQALAHERGDVRDLFLDVTPIGAAETGNRYAAVEDAHVAPLPDQPFDQAHHRALPQVVGIGLEGEPQDSDVTPA